MRSGKHAASVIAAQADGQQVNDPSGMSTGGVWRRSRHVRCQIHL